MGNDENTGLNYCYSCMRQLEEGETVCPDCGHDNSRIQNPENTLPEGTILNGKYLVGRMLGQGGFGVTYLSVDLLLNVRVAIKEYFPVGVGMRAQNSVRVVPVANLSDQDGFRKGYREFQTEAQMLTRFNSPYIVRVRDYFHENGTAYIVMDYVEGNTLTKEVEECGGKIPWERVLDLFKPLILEMDNLHKQHLIHRDIKPDNIKIALDASGREHLVLLDFGTARSFVSAQVTKTYTALVTPGYAPLEQYSPKSRQGPYTDVYALSASMYAAISGVVPAVATDRLAGEADISTFREMSLPVPEQVENAILHGLAVRSADRPQTMKELYDELTAGVEAAIPEEHVNTTVPAPQRDWNREMRQDDLPERPEAKKSGSRWLIPLLILFALLLAGGYFVYRNVSQEYQHIAVTQTAIFLQSEQETHDKETQSAIDTENTRAAQERGTQSAIDAESTRTVQEQETQAAIREQNTRSAQEQMTEQALQRLALQATGTQEAVFAEATAASFSETKQAELHQTETQSVVYTDYTRTAETGQMQQTVQVETQWAQQTQSALDTAHTATAWIATQDAGLQQTLTQSALNFQNTQTVSVQQTAQAQGTAIAIERTREAEQHMTETQSALNVAGTQDALRLQTVQAQGTADALERTREAELILTETQNAVNFAGTQDILAQQTAQAQETAAALERTREAELHQTETQNAVHAVRTQDVLTRQTALAEGTAAALERTRGAELHQTETQSWFDVGSTQEAYEQETAQAVQAAAAWENTQEAIRMVQTDIVRTLDVIYAEQTRAAWVQTQEAVNRMLTEVAQTQEAVNATQTKAAEPTATKTPDTTSTPLPTATKTLTPTITSQPNPKQIKVGDITLFGTYEQDNNLTNGPEPIEWQVLDVQSDRVLLISRYSLDSKHYNDEKIGITWETCTLRKWLNEEFYNSAFNNVEKGRIQQVINQNPDNFTYGTKGGNQTIDRIFLLSSDEAKQYFSDDDARKCYATKYAKEHGGKLFIDDTYGNSNWWLRSPGGDDYRAAEVAFTGSVNDLMGEVVYNQAYYDDIGYADYFYCAVRPALWLNTNGVYDDIIRNEISETTTPTPYVENPIETMSPKVTLFPNTAEIQIGDILTFGSYEQDNIISNGKEAIEWLVLDIEENRALVISKYGLDTVQYNEKKESVTWETSTMRQWLNNIFYNNAFSNDEKNHIQEVTIQNTDNVKYGTNGGNPTTDRIFLLSNDEAVQYFIDNESRQCIATDYAKAKRVYVDHGKSWWWLRSPGRDDTYAAQIYSDGSGPGSGIHVDGTVGAVRPAFWLDLTSSDSSESELIEEITETSAPTDEPEQTAALTPTQINTSQPPTPIPVRVGDFIRFGAYEQDNDPGNGPEEIEWLVLDVQGSRALLISRYGLDTKRYNEEYVSVTWETCTLRTWLNNEFYNSAFSSSDQTQIIEVMNENPNNSDYGTKGGNSTKDKVFLLTVDEANKFMTPGDPLVSRGDRFCRPTAYAKANGAWASVSLDGISHWWLRSPGYNSQFASSVDHWGYVLTYGTGIYADNVVVRPALWLDLSSYDSTESELIEEITETPAPAAEPEHTPAAAPAEDLTALGNEAYQNGDYETALEWYQQAADQGNEEAKVMAVITRINAVRSSKEIVLSSDTLMRNGSSADAAVMRSILKGSLITLTGTERNGWVQIQTQDGLKGWIPQTIIPSSIIAFIEEQLHGFGQYEQDNNLSNGPEPIEWKVLAVEDDRILLISRYGLDAKRYNEVWESVTWETSTLRAWLNNEFYNSAFSSSEQRRIIEVTNENPDNPYYGTKGGNRTRDKVFLLSIDEANRYFVSDEARRCEATAYAKANGANVSYIYGTSWWWLRSPGDLGTYASIVSYVGGVGTYGTSVDYVNVAARPAFWLNL